MPETMPTLSFARTLHGSSNRLGLWMHVATRHAEVAVSGEVGESIGVHVGSPAGQAGMAESVQGEGSELCQFAGADVLLFQARFFNVPAPGGSREYPALTQFCSPLFEQFRDFRAQGNCTPSALRFPM